MFNWTIEDNLIFNSIYLCYVLQVTTDAIRYLVWSMIQLNQVNDYWD